MSTNQNKEKEIKLELVSRLSMAQRFYFAWNALVLGKVVFDFSLNEFVKKLSKKL